MFRRSIDEARERLTRDPQHSRGRKITAEDVNMAAGAYGDSKKEEFNKDTQEDQKRLVEALEKIRRFCLEKNHVNIFLVEQDAATPEHDLIQELIDLRLVHHVRSRVTISDTPGQVYRALLLDVSQYTGARKRRDIEMVEFWKGDRQTLRKGAWVYDPTKPMSEQDRDIKSGTKVRPDRDTTDGSGQLRLFD